MEENYELFVDHLKYDDDEDDEEDIEPVFIYTSDVSIYE